MKHPSIAMPFLLAALACISPAHAAPPVAQVSQLTGFVVAARATGAAKVLAARSVVEQGDTLSTEPGTWLRIALAGGGELLLGPDTRLRLDADRLVLLQGQLRLTALASPLTLQAGETRLSATAATVDVTVVPDTAAALAQRAYARAAMAAAPALATTTTDIPAETAIWQVAQGPVPPTSATTRPSGLYVQVVAGTIGVSNPAGNLNLNAGQFGYTPAFTQPPVTLPTNPGISFTPPAVFVAGTSTSPAGSAGGKSNAVDCEVR